MSQVFAGVTAVVCGPSDVAVLAEIISSLDFETLRSTQDGRPLSITQDQFDLFIARQGRSFIDAGLLDEELMPTGVFNAPLQ